uniref:Uncharacterized protein n=1 Tax=Glossina palpalis gambiensis TaxID=67801 RepID=A0A1B0BV38_9MUSC
LQHIESDKRYLTGSCENYIRGFERTIGDQKQSQFLRFIQSLEGGDKVSRSTLLQKMPENITKNWAVSREQAPAKKNCGYCVAQIRIHEYTVLILADYISQLTISDFDAPSRSEDIKTVNHSKLFRAQSPDEELKCLLTATGSLEFRQVILPETNVQL